MVMALLLAVQASITGEVRPPVVEFPDAALDDSTVYAGYVTRFYRDSAGNTVQIYLEGASGRVVHVWADATNSSTAFTARLMDGSPARLAWDGPATVEQRGTTRSLRSRLRSDAPRLDLGWFTLGTMRQERDLQYADAHLRPFDQERFQLPEFVELVETVERLPPQERQRHLALLGAADVAQLRSRLVPRLSLQRTGATWVFEAEQTSLDGNGHMTLTVSGSSDASAARLVGSVLRVQATGPAPLAIDVTVTSDAATLTPLDRSELLAEPFLRFVDAERSVADSLSRFARPLDRDERARLQDIRRMERDLRGLELLSSREKLMAGLPTYATYFGRDMMMTALMFEPVGTPDLLESVLASVLAKLDDSGEVSHEEALGGQAIRENAVEYVREVRAALVADDAAARTRAFERSRAVLADLQRVRENFRMIDDDLQFPVLLARYLTRPDVPAARKRRFLDTRRADGLTHEQAVLRNLALVAEWAGPYAAGERATDLVGFRFRDEQGRGWLPGSWRDSGAGYGWGRFGMDVNVIWMPQALEALQRILDVLGTLGYDPAADPTRGAILRTWLHEPARLTQAVDAWRGSRRHFQVTLPAAAVAEHITAALERLPADERTFWVGRAAARPVGRDLSFLAIALDSLGQPIPVLNTDPATELYLRDFTTEVLRGTTAPETVLALVDPMVRPYPEGLWVPELGPVVANDVYASERVQESYRRDPYHSPRVVWGREVNLLVLGLTRQIAAAYDARGVLRDDSPALRTYVSTLRAALERILASVEASGLSHSELWSYRVANGTLTPIRYGTSGDIQLWSTTRLAVRFQLSRLPEG